MAKFWQSLFLFSVTIGLALADLDYECPPFWTRFGDNCYQFFGLAKSWGEAEAHCQKFFTRFGEGHLTSIQSSDENNFVGYLWKISSGSTEEPAWIGLNDIRVEGKFRWSDNSVFYYKAWNPREPNNYLGQEDCTEITRKDDKFGWNDQTCTDLNTFVCKVPIVH